LPSPHQATAEANTAQPGSNAEVGDAEQLLARAKERYRAHDLQGALSLLQKCHTATGDPNLLFNIAQVMRDLNLCSGALENYRAYIREAPEGERVADATDQIAKLEPVCETNAQRQVPQPRPQREQLPLTPESKPNPLWPTLGWTSCASSVLAGAAATYFGLQSHAAKDDVEQLQQQPHFQASRLQSRLDDFYHDRNWAVGFGVASGITAAVGLYLLIVVTPEQRQKSRIVTSSVPGRSFDLELRF
jgi:hypothetical protein